MVYGEYKYNDKYSLSMNTIYAKLEEKYSHRYNAWHISWERLFKYDSIESNKYLYHLARENIRSYQRGSDFSQEVVTGIALHTE